MKDNSKYTMESEEERALQKRDEAEVVLTNFEVRYPQLLENLCQEYFFYSYNSEMQFTYISPSASSMLGYANTELVELGVLDDIVRYGPINSNENDLQPSYDEELLCRYIEIVASDKSIRYIKLHEMPVCDMNGKFIAFDGMARDITEDKIRERHLKDSEQRLRELAAHLENVRENERASIARDIHDEIGGYLMALKMDIGLLNKKLVKADKLIVSRFQSMTQLLDVAIEATRRMITNLRPSVLDELGLLEALEWQLNVFSKRYNVGVMFNHDKDIDKLEFVNPSYSVDVFRIFQEILNNIAKHANASMVTTFASLHGGYFILSVSDNGVGIPETGMKKRDAFGILGMQERAYKMGGNIEFISEENIGTTVILQIPLKSN